VAEAKAEEGARGRRKRPAAGAPAAAARSGESLDLLHMAAFLGLKDDCQFLWKTYKSVLGSEAPRRSFGKAQSLHSASSSEVDAGRRFFQADPYGFEVVNYALLALKSEQDSSLLSANFVFAQHQREAFSQQCKASLGNNAVMKALA
jgi:hypothetical protein